MNTESTFHMIELLIQSGLLGAVVVIMWKASAVIQDFHSVKSRQEEHLADDKEQFATIDDKLDGLQRGVARIEGRLAK